MHVNQKELAEILSISTRRIQQLSSENGIFKRNEQKKYDVAECVQDYLQYKLESTNSDGKVPEYWAEKAKHEEQKRKITEIKLSRMKRESFDVDDVEEAWSMLILDFKNKLLNLPHKLATSVIGEKDIFVITQIFEEEIEGALWELSGFDVDSIESNGELMADEDETEYILFSSEDGEAPPTAQETDSKPMGRRKQKTKQ